MKLQTLACALGATTLSGSICSAALVSVSQSVTGGNAVNAVPPQVEAGLFVDESFAFTNRTHEMTAARYASGTNLLSTTGDTLLAWPSYFNNAQWVANANDNRTAGIANDAASYTVTYTVNTPGIAYLLLDNRLNGTGSNATNSAGTTDPDLGGSLAWVLNDGWVRVNTGITPPGGTGDYVGIDEGASVANAAARVHTGAGNVAGSGEGLNQFFSVYSKEITTPGTFETRSIRLTTGAGNMYVVAFASVPEPTAPLLGLLSLGFIAFRRRRP
jgi:MYXO-CTERM domain-containing protein